MLSRSRSLSAHPGSSDSRGDVCSCKAPEHDADHGEADECGNCCGIALKVAGQTAVATDPGKRPLDNPSLGQNFEAAGIRSLHDLQFPCSCAPDDERHLLTGIATISKNALDEWEQSSRPAQQMECSVTVLNIGRMDDDVQQETQRVDQDVPLATLDLLARVVARRIEPSPLFASLWLFASR